MQRQVSGWKMKRLRGGGLVVLSALCMAMNGTPVVRADDASTAGDKAEIQMLRDRLDRLEQRVAAKESGGDVAIEDKPASGLELPSGLAGVKLSGYADVSYVYNFAEGDGSGRANRGRAFDTESNGFTPHAFKLVFERPMDDTMPIGFRADLLAGDDAPVIASTGLSSGVGDEFDLEQLYVTAKAPIGEGIDFKVGKFVTLLGAEVIESPANWNFSRSFMFLHAIPFTHTGALATYPLGDMGSVTAGVVNGWDIVDDNNKGKSFLGNLTLTPMAGVTLSNNLITGPEQATDTRDDRTVYDFVGSWQATDDLALMMNYDYGHESGVTGCGAGCSAAEWQGLALYAKYNLSPTWALVSRVEWFDDKDGVRTAFTGQDGASPTDLDLYSYTFTSQWNLHEHVIARLEYRHDKADEDMFFHDGGGFINYQDTIAAEMIYHF